MRRSSYKDGDGKLYAVWLPDDADDKDADRGIVIGPSDISGLDLPKDVGVRLHNELYMRELFTSRDMIRQRKDVQGAIQAALKLDTENIIAAAIAYEKGN